MTYVISSLQPWIGTFEKVSIYICIMLLFGTSFLHSVLGEKRLIGPLLTQREGVLVSYRIRFLLRAVWHFMTVLFWIVGVFLFSGLISSDGVQVISLWAIAIGIGGAGVYDSIGTRGQHVGWPFLFGIGVFAAIAAICRSMVG